MKHAAAERPPLALKSCRCSGLVMPRSAGPMAGCSSPPDRFCALPHSHTVTATRCSQVSRARGKGEKGSGVFVPGHGDSPRWPVCWPSFYPLAFGTTVSPWQGGNKAIRASPMVADKESDKAYGPSTECSVAKTRLDSWAPGYNKTEYIVCAEK